MNQLLIAELKPIIEDVVLEIINSKEKDEVKEKWLNLGEAAEYIGVSRNTLKKFINQGDIELYVLNGIKRVSQLELNTFIKDKGRGKCVKQKNGKRNYIR